MKKGKNVSLAKSLIYIIFWALIYFNGAGSCSYASGQCDMPPFIASGVKPNVIIMLDNSGSMKDFLHRIDRDTFDPDRSYYGIFDSDKNYEYNKNIPVDPNPWKGASDAPYNVNVDTNATGAFVEANCTISTGSNCWSGNYLNFLTTRRIDAARKALVGGKVESRKGYDYIPGDGGDLEWKIIANNEPEDGRREQKGNLSDCGAYTPYPNNSYFEVFSPAADGTTQSSYDPYAKLKVKPSRVIIHDKYGNPIGEAGEITLPAYHMGDPWPEVEFSGNYTDPPVVIVGPPSYNGSHPGIVRVKGLTKTGFKLRFQEWVYKDGGHTSETVYYMAVKPGRHLLPGDKVLEAGKTESLPITGQDGCAHKGNNYQLQWKQVDFSGTMTDPVVLTTITTFHADGESTGDEDDTHNTVTTRLQNVGNSSFEFALQEEEEQGNHVSETVAWIAIEKGTVTFSDSLKIKVGYINNVGKDFKSKSFPSGFKADFFLADIQTYNGPDTAALRFKDLKPTKVKISVKEETSCDDETNHNPETVGYVAISSGLSPKYYNLALVVEDEPTGLVQRVKGKVRLGVSEYWYNQDGNIYNGESGDGGTLSLDIPKNPFVKNDNDIGGYRRIYTHVKSDVANIVDAIEHYPLVWGTTPLAENYYELLRYFMQESPYYDPYPPRTAFEQNDTWDPYYYDEFGEKVRCAKSYIVVFTDGEPYKDFNVPSLPGCSGGGGPGRTNGPDCDHDGHEPWDTGSSCSANSNANSNYLDDLSWWAHNNDIRDDLDGNQSITTYAVIFGVDEQCSEYEDNVTCLNNGCKWEDDRCWPGDALEECRQAIMKDTADNGGGKFYYAADGEQLAQAFNAIMGSIMNSGAASSVATVTQEVLGEDLVIRGAFTLYDDDPDVYTWRGHLEIYEPFFHCVDFTNSVDCEARGCTWDGNSCSGEPDINYDFELCRDDSCPSEYCIDTGTRCVSKFCADIDPGVTKHCMDAGEILMHRNEPRKIFTYLDGEKKQFDVTDNTTAIFWNNYLNVKDEDFDGNGTGGTASDITKLIKFIRGEDNGDGIHMREREKGWILGDIVYSSPVVVGPPAETSVPEQIARDGCDMLQKCFAYTTPEECNNAASDYGCFWSYYQDLCISSDCEDLENQHICENQPACQWQSGKCVDKNLDQILGQMNSDDIDKCFYSFRMHHINRERVIYVGANDGMLHAFSVGTGRELWAYIPSNLLPKLKYLADPQYGKSGGCRHISMVDLSPRIWNVRFSDKTWHTVLIGGERGGGDVYFAIDITNPENPDVLWEYSTFRNMVLHDSASPTAPFDKDKYLDLNGTYMVPSNFIKATWTEPTLAYIPLGDGVKFDAYDPVSPWSDASLAGNIPEKDQSNLSDWFAVIGGSLHIYNKDELPNFLTDSQKDELFQPYLLMIDIEHGINIFQNFWPDAVKSLSLPQKTNGDNIIPYAFSTPLLLDVWDTNGCSDISSASGVSDERKRNICEKAKYCTWSQGECKGTLLGPDGVIDHIILGDMNGNFYNIKFNFSSNETTQNFFAIDKSITKKIDEPSPNMHRSDRQPITIPSVAAFDDDFALRIFTGAGMLDNGDDANDPAIMSFYNIREDSAGINGTGISYQYAQGFNVFYNDKCDDNNTMFMNNCAWTKDGLPDCCENNCDNSCWDCIFDLKQPGERILYSPLVAGGLVFVTSFVPNEDPCSSGGKGYLYILKYNCKDLIKNCGDYGDPAECSTQESCFWNASESSCVGCEEFDSNSTCSMHIGCKWVSAGNNEYCTSTQDILSESGLKPALGKGVSELNMGEYTTIGNTGYAINLGPGVPSQPIYSQNKGNKATLFIQTSDAKIFKIDLSAKDRRFLGWSWDQQKVLK